MSFIVHKDFCLNHICIYMKFLHWGRLYILYKAPAAESSVPAMGMKSIDLVSFEVRNEVQHFPDGFTPSFELNSTAVIHEGRVYAWIGGEEDMFELTKENDNSICWKRLPSVGLPETSDYAFSRVIDDTLFYYFFFADINEMVISRLNMSTMHWSMRRRPYYDLHEHVFFNKKSYEMLICGDDAHFFHNERAGLKHKIVNLDTLVARSVDHSATLQRPDFPKYPNFGMFIADGRLMLRGGTTNDAFEDGIQRLYRFDEKTNAWVRDRIVSYPLHAFPARYWVHVEHGSRIYFMGGSYSFQRPLLHYITVLEMNPTLLDLAAACVIRTKNEDFVDVLPGEMIEFLVKRGARKPRRD